MSLILLFTALPTLPLITIPFTDADGRTALSFVKAKLAGLHLSQDMTTREVNLVESLGGRASDLEIVCV